MTLATFYVFTTTILALFGPCRGNSRFCNACAGPKSDCINNPRTDFLKMECENGTVEGVSLWERTLEHEFLEEMGVVLGVKQPSVDVGCLKLTFRNRSSEVSDRAVLSCVPEQVEGQGVCEALGELVEFLGLEKEECFFCKGDDCNGVSSGKLSVVLVLTVMYLVKLFR